MRRGERRGARRTGGDCSVSLASHCVQGSRRAVPMCGPPGPAARALHDRATACCSGQHNISRTTARHVPGGELCPVKASNAGPCAARRSAADSAARAAGQARAARHVLAGVPLQRRRDLRAHLGVRGLHVRRPQDAAPRLRVGVRRRRVHAGAAPAPPRPSGAGRLPLGPRPTSDACRAWWRAGAACARAGAAQSVARASASRVGSSRLRPSARVRCLFLSAGEACNRWFTGIPSACF